MNMKRAGSMFFSGIVLGLAVFVGVSSAAAPAPAKAAPVPLGSQIVCFVFSTLNGIGSPIPHLSSEGCAIGEVPQSNTGVLVVKKTVLIGSATPDQFSFSVNGGSPISFNANGENDLTVATNTPYTVVETASSNYTPVYFGCSSITVVGGATSTCTIINTFTGGGGGGGGTASTSDLSMAKTVSTSTPNQGQTITYTLTVHNSGPDAAQHVSITDLLPAGLTYVSNDSTGAYASSTGLWNVGTVTTAVDAILHILAKVGSTTNTIINRASITAASSTDPNSGNNTASVSITPMATSTNGGGGGTGTTATTSDLSISKTVNTNTPAQGATITYTLTVHNAGPNTAQHVAITDVLPAGLTYVSDDSSGKYASSTTGVWSVGTVGTTSDAVLHILAKVGNTTSPITNTASITAASSTDPNTENNSSSVSITPASSNTGGGGTDVTPPATTGGGGGGGGGGIISGPLSFGYGVGGGGGYLTPGVVLGTSTQATSCGLYLTNYLRIGRPNSADQVTKLQTFLNSYIDTKLPVTGFFGSLTDTAVRKFQAQYAVDVLEPWIPYGLLDHQTTGYVYKTTQRKINLIMCSELNLPMPMLP